MPGNAEMETTSPMKILVLGAGATGGYFGGRMAASGADVTFLVRPARAEKLSRDGLIIESPFGNLKTAVKTVTRETLTGAYDVVLLSCKSYDLASSIEDIRPAIGKSTQVLPLLNGIKHLDDLDAAFSRDHVLGGLCHLSVTLSPDGVVQHLNKLHLLTFGPRVSGQIKLCRDLVPVMERSGFAPKLSPNVIVDMWGKWVLLATLAGLTCLMRASVGEIIGTRDGHYLTLVFIDECAEIALLNGYPLPDAQLKHIGDLLTDPSSQVVASMRRDMQRGAQIEGDHIIGDMLARGEAKGIQPLMLRIAYANAEAYQNRRPVTAI